MFMHSYTFNRQFSNNDIRFPGFNDRVLETSLFFYKNKEEVRIAISFIASLLSTWGRKWQPMEDVKGMWYTE